MSSGNVRAFPRYRLFSATWTEFRPEAQLASLPQTAAGANALNRTLRALDALADEAIHLRDRDGVSSITAVEDFLALPGDDVILYFASHGLVSAGANPFFCLATGDTRELGDLTRALPVSEIAERLTRAKAARKLLIIDACYSGRAGSSLFNQAFSNGSAPPGLSLLASSGPFTPSLAPSDEPLTSFTGGLVSILGAGLSSEPATLSARELFEALRKNLAAQDAPEPWLVAHGSSADAIVFRNAARAEAGTVDPQRYSDLTARYDHRTEILYVDDEAGYRSTFKKSLEDAGHHVTVAEDPRSAMQELRAAHFDIVVLDVLETGDDPATDLIRVCTTEASDSDIFLVSRRDAGTKKIWAQLDAIFPYPNRIRAFLWKPDYVGTITVLADRVRETRRQVLANVSNVEDAVPLIAGRMIKRDPQLADHSERLQLQARIVLERLVSRWFAPASSSRFVESMTLRLIDSGRSVCSVFTVIPRLQGIETTDVMPLVLKMGPAREIAQEERRYDTYVQVGVPLDLRTDKLGCVCVGQVGGILYSFRGGRDGKIEEVGGLGADEIGECLGVVFDARASRRWHSARGAPAQPLAHYRSLQYDRFQQAVDGLRASLGEIVGSGAKTKRKNPAAANDVPEIRAVHESHVMNISHDSTLVHGDLTLSNLVRCGKRRYALIDYRTVGLGPRLVDFATIEVSCWLTAPAPERARADLFAEARQGIVGELWDLRDPSDVPEWLRDARALAMQCRTLAFENFTDHPPTVLEYASLLWLATVRRSEFKSSATSAVERRTLKVLSPALALAAQEMIDREESTI